MQWLQTYEVDRETVSTIYATLLSVFPQVETYQTQEGDMLLVGSMQPLLYDAQVLRRRIDTEPWKSAMRAAWRTDSLEGFLSHFVAGSKFARAMAADAEINSDDRTVVEFAFARNVGTNASVSVSDLRRVAVERQQHHPENVRGEISWPAVERERPYIMPEESVEKILPPSVKAANLTVTNPAMLAQLAEKEANVGNPAALPYISALGRIQPTEAYVILSRLLWRQGRIEESAAALEKGFLRYRVDPWPMRPIMGRGMEVAKDIAVRGNREMTLRLYHSLSQPFSVYVLNESRIQTMNTLARQLEGDGCGPLTLASTQRWEPHVPWNELLLRQRRDCYRKFNDPRSDVAQRELEEFLEAEPLPLAVGARISESQPVSE